MSNRKAVCFMAALVLVATGLVSEGFADLVLNGSFETATADWRFNSGLGSGGAFTEPVAASSVGLALTATGISVGQVQSPSYSTGTLYQNLTEKFAAGTTYDLTAAIGAQTMSPAPPPTTPHRSIGR